MRKQIILLMLAYGICHNPLNAQLVRFGFIGNSITIGTGLSSPQTECYPAQIGLLLNQKYGDTCEVRNFAVSGRTLLRQGDYPIWNEPDFRRALNYAPDILFVMLGTNDSKPQNWDSYGQNFFADYQAMLDTFRWRNPHVKFIVCLPPPAFDIVWGIRDSVIKNYVIPLVDSIAKLYNAVLIDFYTPLRDSVVLFPDKIHPNARGAKVMAQIAFEQILASDIVHQVDTGYTFVTSCEAKPAGDLRRGDTVTISYTTLRAQQVFINGQEVLPNGSIKLAPPSDTTLIIKAVGLLNTDSIVYTQHVYIPQLNRLLVVATRTSFFPGDTITLMARYFDQKSALMKDTTFNLTWNIKQGKGRLFDAGDNQIKLIADSTGNLVVNCQADNGVTYDLKLFVRTPTAVAAPAQNTIGLYPNPANDLLTLQVAATVSPVTVVVYSISGKPLIHSTIPSGVNTLQLNVSQLPSGVYLCKIVNGSQATVKRFFIAR